MNGWIIALIVVAAIIILLIISFRIIKKKIRNKLIDAGADIVTKVTENVLDEKTAGVVQEAAGITADILKNDGGVSGVITAAAKKGLEIANDNENPS